MSAGFAIAPRFVSRKEQTFLLLCPVTVFLSAFLLFLIEPMIAKVMLPWFGGSAAVWATCLVFFQLALLSGYYYADLLSRLLAPKQQMTIHIVLLALSLSFLPRLASAVPKTHAGEDPVWGILLFLLSTIGLPFVLLSATSPLAQSWFKRSHSQGDPYHLFSLSNCASFLALLSYPFLIEPRISTVAQTRVWSLLFAVFATLCAAMALSTGTNGELADFSADRTRSVPLLRQLHWLILSACGSMLLLTITNHLTQNVTPVPLLWVLPLALYLLSFTLVFSRKQFYRRKLFTWLLAIFLDIMCYAVYDSHGLNAVQISVPLFCTGLFVCCMFCHGELKRLKPESKNLTSFYLMLSLGGVIGAMFVGLAAPRLFPNLYEFPMTLLLTGLLALVTMWQDGWFWRALWCAMSVALAYVLVIRVEGLQHESIAMMRNFYGALRITETRDFGGRLSRRLYHGVILHGAQYRSLPWRKVPVSYYSFDSGIGLALQFCCAGPKRVGVIGLGTGTLAAYGKPGDYFHFYDINPNVIKIAKSYFTYLQESPAETEITLGDARLSLASEAPQCFDVLAVDAFSGDAIPVHLLTQQALALYLRHLKPNGILAIHTSNTFLMLETVVKQAADQLGYPVKLVESEDDDQLSVAHSDWVLLSQNSRFMTSLVVTQREMPITSIKGMRPWTDERNNLFQILRPPQIFSQDR